MRLEETTTEILGNQIPNFEIPIRPGRNLAVIIEAAAANYRYSLVSNVTPVGVISERIQELRKEDGGDE